MVVGGVLKGRNLAVLAEGSNSYAAVMADTGVLDLQGSSWFQNNTQPWTLLIREIAEPERLPPLVTLPCTEILQLSWPQILLVRLT